jgi:hypothetical protein
MSVPAGAEPDAVDSGEDVDPLGRVAELHDDALFEEVGRCEAEGAEAKAIHSGDEPVGVLLVDPHPDVEVFVSRDSRGRPRRIHRRF